MKLIIDKNRKVYSAGTWGTKNENNYEILDFEFPEELEEYNKRIVYYLGNERVWDTIVDNKAYITNAITTKGSVKAYVWLTKENTEREADTDFRTQLFEMQFYENENADGIVPTPEQVDGFNTMLTAMNNKIDEVDALEQTIEAAERTRQANETTRQNNETTRQENEQTRQSQEAERERKTDEAIADIEDKTAEYNANAEAKTTAFNNNATQKTNDFNSNYTQKVNDFNSNATNKTNDFNSNASSKTTAFNDNAASKTNTFNSNASSKTTDFNTNAENKTSAFNDNATQKTTNFDNNASSKTTTFNENATSKTNDFNDNATQKTTDFNNNAQAKTDAFDEHTEEMQQEIDELSANMPWNTTEQATEISVDDAAKYSKNKLELFGNTEQIQYTGKNLFSGWEEGLINPTTGEEYIYAGRYRSRGYIEIESNTNYYFSMLQPSSAQSFWVYIYKYDENKQYIGRQPLKDGAPQAYENIVNISDTTTKYIRFTEIVSAEYINKTQFELGTERTLYEPYTGGVPSPNPDYPQDIHVVTGNNSIGVQGKNYVALNREGLETTHSYTHNYDSYTFGIKQYTKLPAGSYTMMFKLKSSDNGKFNKVHLKGPNNSDITVLTLYRTIPSDYTEYVQTFTIAQPTEIRAIFTQNAEGTGTFTFKDIMVVAGTYTSSNVPEYDIYRNTDYSLNLGSLELCKIGNYQDYLYKENGNWYKYGAVKKVVLDGIDEDWVIGTGKTLTQVFNGNNVLSPIIQANVGYCNCFINQEGDTEKFGTSITNPTKLYIAVLKTRASTVTEFKTWLAEHNLLFYYPISTPTTTQITDETLIAQLDAIYEHLKLVKGTNNITVTASDLAPYMELTYMQDLKAKLDNLDSRLSLLE